MVGDVWVCDLIDAKAAARRGRSGSYRVRMSIVSLSACLSVSLFIQLFKHQAPLFHFHFNMAQELARPVMLYGALKREGA